MPLSDGVNDIVVRQFSLSVVRTSSPLHPWKELLKSKLKRILTLQLIQTLSFSVSLYLYLPPILMPLLHPYLTEYNLYNFVHLTGERQNI